MTGFFTKIFLALAICSIADSALATKFLNYKNPTRLLGNRTPSEIDSVYNDDVFISGATQIKFDSKVNGDLFSISYEMVQTDTVTGNFMAVAMSMQNLGPVIGSYRAVAWKLSCNSNIDRNLLLLAHDVTVAPTARIGRDADIAASDVVFQGEVKHDLNISAKTATVSGKVGGNLEFRGDSLTVNPNSVVTGDINYYSPVRAVIAPGSVIGGKINWNRAEVKKDKGSGPFWIIPTWIISVRGYFILSTLISAVVIAVTFAKLPTWFLLIALWLMLAVSGNIIILVSKSKARDTERVLQARLLPSIGLGFIFFFLTPILATMLLFTVLAAPLAPLVMMLLGMGVFAGAIYASLFVGRRICSIFSPVSAGTPGYLCYTIGMTVILLLSAVPIVGYLMVLVVLMTGLGGLLQTYMRPKIETAAESAAANTIFLL
jgi:hypothetical protein